MKVSTNDVYDKFCSLFKDNRFTHVGIDPAYNVFRFNRNTHFERHHTMPVQFEQDMLFTQDGMETIRDRILSEQVYFYGFTEETKSNDAKTFICETLIPTYSKDRWDLEKSAEDLSDDILKALDYFRYNSQFNVLMAIDVARGFVEAPTVGEMCQLFTAPNINWYGDADLYDFIQESLDIGTTIFDLVVDLYNKDIWRRND